MLFIHGERDSAIPVSMAEALYAKAPGPRFFHVVPEADHNDTYQVGGTAYFEEWKRFVAWCSGYREGKA